MKRDAILRLLPSVFQRTAAEGTPLLALLAAMEQLHAPSEQILQNVSGIFNPHATPERFLPYLSRWVNLDWLFEPILEDWSRHPAQHPPFPPGVHCMRELVALGFRLNRESGTANGLLLFLRTATGLSNFTIDAHPPGPDGVPLAYHMLIHAPQQAAPFRAMLQRIIEFEKPAFMTFELVFEGAAVTGG